jgi:hypothetical protein
MLAQGVEAELMDVLVKHADPKAGNNRQRLGRHCHLSRRLGSDGEVVPLSRAQSLKICMACI